MLQNEINVLNKNNTTLKSNIVTVSNVTLTQVSCNNVAHGMDPLFYMEYTFMGANNNFKIGVPLENLYLDFAHFFDKYLANLFN